MTISEIRITLCQDEKLKAYATVTFDDAFVIHGLKVIKGREQTFVAMPNRRLKDGTYQDIAHPINMKTRRWLEDAVLRAYREAVEGYYQLPPSTRDAPVVSGLKVSDGLCERLKASVMQELHGILVGAIRQGGTLSYQDMVDAAARRLDIAVCRDDVDHILCELSTCEHDAGRPLISAAVVDDKTRQPDWPFFAMARALGVHDGKTDTAFHKGELARVHAYWSREAV